jgi:hypothetical protein
LLDFNVKFIDAAVAYQIKKLALEQNTTLQKLLTEALNDLIIKYKGKYSS